MHTHAHTDTMVVRVRDNSASVSIAVPVSVGVKWIPARLAERKVSERSLQLISSVRPKQPNFQILFLRNRVNFAHICPRKVLLGYDNEYNRLSFSFFISLSLWLSYLSWNKVHTHPAHSFYKCGASHARMHVHLQ